MLHTPTMLTGVQCVGTLSCGMVPRSHGVPGYSVRLRFQLPKPNTWLEPKPPRKPSGSCLCFPKYVPTKQSNVFYEVTIKAH